jgi:hypothetical protein
MYDSPYLNADEQAEFKEISALYSKSLNDRLNRVAGFDLDQHNDILNAKDTLTEYLKRKTYAREYLALINSNFPQGQIEGWYFVAMDEEFYDLYSRCQDDDSWLDENDTCDFCETSFKRVCEQHHLPDNDVLMIDPAHFPEFRHMILMRGDSAFSCRMHGRRVIPVSEIDASILADAAP